MSALLSSNIYSVII